MRAEELEAELHAAGVIAHRAGDRRRPIERRGVDRDEDRAHTTGSCFVGSGSGGQRRDAIRSIASMRRRCDQMRARIISQVGSEADQEDDQQQDRQLDVGLDVAPQVQR